MPWCIRKNGGKYGIKRENTSQLVSRQRFGGNGRQNHERAGLPFADQFYSALLNDAVADEVTDKHKEILGEKFAEAMTEYVEEIKRAVSKGLYRYAVHQEIISRMMAEHYGYSYTDVHDMMWEACKNVRRLRGKVPLEQILAGYYTKHQIETILPTEEVYEEDF